MSTRMRFSSSRGTFAIGDIRADAWKQIPSAIADAENAVIHTFAARL